MRSVGSGVLLVAFIFLANSGVAQAARPVEEQRLCVSVVVEVGNCSYDQVYNEDGELPEDTCSANQADCPANYPYHQKTTITQPCGGFHPTYFCHNSTWSGSIECCNQPAPQLQARPRPVPPGGVDDRRLDEREFFD